MRLTDGLSRGQRVVVVVALGLALGVTGTYLMGLGRGSGGGIGFGWYAYAPLTTTLQAPGTGLPAWLRLIIWLVLVGLWALASITVLRPPADQGTPG